jgi:hypothetical protein
MPNPTQRKAQILQEMAEIDRMQRGRLSEQFFKRFKEGREVTLGPYYVLQRWCEGKNICQRVPAREVASVRSAIEGYERFEKLATEYVEISEAMASQRDKLEEGAKKNARKSGQRSLRKPKRS